MGEFQKHLSIAKEKYSAIRTAFANNQNSVVGDLGTKVVEQLIEADAARSGIHIGNHNDRHLFSGAKYPKEMNVLFKKVWFAYSDLGYDGGNGERAKAVIEHLASIIMFFEERLGVKIEE